MSKKYIFFLFIISIKCFESRGLIDRITGDYFPLEKGKIWRYIHYPGQDTVIREVMGDTNLINTDFIILLHSGIEFLFQKEKNFVYKYFKESVIFYDKEYILEEEKLPFLPLIFIDGEEHIDSVHKIFEISGDTLYYMRVNHFYLKGPLSLKIEGKEYINLYQVSRRFKVVKKGIGYDSEEISQSEEFYAPDIGMVFSITGGDTLAYFARESF